MDIDEFLDKEAELIDQEPLDEIIPEKKPEEGYKGLLKKLSSCISKKDFTGVEKLYSMLWAKISEEKYTWNKDLYNSLIEVNKKLGEILDSLSQETAEKIKTLHSLIAKARTSLKQGDVESALTTHSELTAAYNGIPSVFEGEKKKVYMGGIAPFNKELRDQVGNNFLHDFDSGLSQINNLIGSVKAELQKGNIEEAAKFYAACLHSYNSLPDGFFLQKLEKSNKLLELYKELAITIEISDLKSKLKLAPVKEHPGVSDKQIKELKQARDEPDANMSRLEKEIKTLSSRLKTQKKDYEQELTQQEKEEEDKIKRLAADYEKKKLELNESFKEKLGEKNQTFEHEMHEKEHAFKAQIAKQERELEEAKENSQKKKGSFRRLAAKQALPKPIPFHKEPPHFDMSEIATHNLLASARSNRASSEHAQEHDPRFSAAVLDKHKKPTHPEIAKRLKPAAKKYSNLSDLDEELIKRKLDRARFEINKGYTKKAGKDLQDAMSIDAGNEEAKKLLDSLKLEKEIPKRVPSPVNPPGNQYPPHSFPKPSLHAKTHSHIEKLQKTVHRAISKSGPASSKTSIVSDLKEELIKRKLDRARFEIGRGYIKEAGKDIEGALRLEPENRQAKELLGKLREKEQKTLPREKTYNIEALKREIAKSKIKKQPIIRLNH